MTARAPGVVRVSAARSVGVDSDRERRAEGFPESDKTPLPPSPLSPLSYSRDAPSSGMTNMSTSGFPTSSSAQRRLSEVCIT